MPFSIHSISGRWIEALAIWAAIALGLIVLKAIVVRVLAPWAKKSRTTLDDEVLTVIRSISPLFLLAAALAFADPWIPLHSAPVVRDIVVVALAIQILMTGSSIVGPLAGHLLFRRDPSGDNETAKNALDILFKVVLWVVVALLTLQNLGVKISTLLAGIGVGGIAVGLALQNVASDLFASLSIMLDKPFRIGDFIVLNTFSGNVERIGIKSTRIRSLTGEELIIPNTDLTVGSIHNYKRMSERRILFAVGVTYSTPVDKVKAIPGMIKEIIEAKPTTRFDRAHFKDFGASSLDFEVVYYSLSPDYTTFMDTQQAINLELLETFNREGIEFAFPTQTIMIDSGESDNPGGGSS